MLEIPRPELARLAAAAALNGATGGAPAGQFRARPLRPAVPIVPPEQTQAIIEHTALCVMEGQSPYNARPLINPITDNDRAQLARFTGISADEFTNRLTTHLRALADLTAARIQQKLEADKFKPHELSFLLTVAVDKLQRVEGRGQIQGANVNVQINNFGPSTKDEIIARLTGETFDLTPVVAPAEPQKSPDVIASGLGDGVALPPA